MRGRGGEGGLTGICTAFKDRLMHKHISKWFLPSGSPSGSRKWFPQWFLPSGSSQVVRRVRLEVHPSGWLAVL